jgi:Zn-finger protein
MKTKMKTILSVCMLTVLLYACTKSDRGPLDCMGIENGTAISDDCGDCHKWTAYNYVAHIVREVNDTTTEVLGENEIFASPNNPMNPAWNLCPDCMGVSNGVAAVDSCGDCHQSYIYDYVSHIPTYINDTTGLVLGATEMLVLAGSADDIASNPNWNTGCTE